jgi:hypothetical protein
MSDVLSICPMFSRYVRCSLDMSDVLSICPMSDVRCPMSEVLRGLGFIDYGRFSYGCSKAGAILFTHKLFFISYTGNSLVVAA